MIRCPANQQFSAPVTVTPVKTEPLRIRPYLPPIGTDKSEPGLARPETFRLFQAVRSNLKLLIRKS